MDDRIDDFDPETGNTKKKNWFKNYPLYIHIGFLILLLLVLFVFWTSDFNFFSDDDERPELSLVGKQAEFMIDYQGELGVSTSQFSLTSPAGKFDGRSQNFFIRDFDGTIYLINESMYFRGTASNITFGQNELNVGGQEFVLFSPKRTTFSVNLELLTLNFNDGVLKFGDGLTYNFKNSTVDMQGVNASISYDGTFSFRGIVDDFLAKTPSNIEISYSFNKTQE